MSDLKTDLATRAWMSSRGSGEWRRAICPFCPMALGKEDRRGSLSFNAESGYFECWRCHENGWIDGDDWTPAPKVEVQAPTTIRPPEGFVSLADPDVRSSIVLEPAIKYLTKKRGLRMRTIEDAGIGACLLGYFGGRIVVPIFDDDDRTWVGFVARLWRKEKKDELRYAYPKGMRRAVIMFDRYLLDDVTNKPVMVVEGVMDALPYLGRAVAVLGKPSHAHVEMLAKSRRPVAVVLDGDAHREGWALARRLRLRGVRSGAVRLPAKTDPNDQDHEAVMRAARACIGADKPIRLEV